ncbi:MAG: hypothetical protein LBP68_06755 [Acidobacteriota bacterium]|jgi:chromosome segregation ATPase|nr:hypothetical protein [Acidobacteriota bacterium]
MKIKIIHVCLATAFLFLNLCPLWSAQSLADVARAEAERRRLLDEQGIEGKVVDGTLPEWASSGELHAEDTSPPAAAREKTSKRDTGDGERLRGTLQKYRAGLQRLDKAIQKEERALESKRRRLETARRAPPAPIRLGRVSTRNAAAETMQRLEAEMKDIEANLRQLREERSDLYDEGRRDDFLPGELEGKGGVY